MQLPARAQSVVDALFRVSFSGIFLVAAYHHFANPAVTVGRLVEAPLAGLVTGVASAESLVLLSGMALALGGVALLVGLGTRAAALLLALVMVPITLTVHIGNPGHLGPLFKNVALMGGLLHFATRGGGAYSLDGLVSSGRMGRVGVAAAAGLGALLAAGGALTPSAAPAEASGQAERGAVILVQNAPQVPVVLNSAARLARDGSPEVHVVACAAAVGALQEGEALEAARQAGVRVVACGLTLEKKGLEADALPPGVDVVPNGILETLRLQERGLLSIEL